jgi:ABC-2 type transport system permease protein
MQIIWTCGYTFCFIITYAYNAYFWDNSIAIELIPAAINWWLFGTFTISLMILFSVLSRKYSGVLLGTGAVLLASFVVGLIPKAAKYMPTSLMNSAALLIGQETWSEYTATITITAVLSVISIIASIPIFNKKTL